MSNVKNKNEIYKCEVCGNIIEVLSVGGGELVCCQKPMSHIRENSIDAGKEKHIPIVKIENDKMLVTVGEIKHPMSDEHYIQWIEVILGEKIYRKNLKPNENPNTTFEILNHSKEIIVRAYCNIHGLWISKH